MSLVSVLENPTYSFQYPEGFNIVDTLILKKLVAYDSDSNNVRSTQDMLIGATANVNIEAADNIQMYVQPTGTLDLYTSEYVDSTRTDTKVLSISAPTTVETLITTSNQTLEVRGNDALKTTTVSRVVIATSNDGSNQHFMLPVGEQFHFNNTMNVGGDLNVTSNTIIKKSLLVNDHIISYGNIFGSNLNLWRVFDSNVAENSNVGQVGYGFRVNTNHQLELVKYTKFGDKTIAKRVALFGQAKFNESMSNDQGVEYTTFSDMAGVMNLPEMPDANSPTVDLSQPIQTYWATSPQGIFYNSGYVGISNNNPEFPLDVSGAARFDGVLTTVAVIQQTATTSDARLKNEISSISPSECLDLINSLRVTKYAFKDDPEQKELVGLIAQEVQNVMPGAVSETKFKGIDDCKMIDYNQIIAKLIGAVQHLSDMMTDLQAR